MPTAPQDAPPEAFAWVRLTAYEPAFRSTFSNSAPSSGTVWTPEKHARLGENGFVTAFDDATTTVTICFADGCSECFPFAAVEAYEALYQPNPLSRFLHARFIREAVWDLLSRLRAEDGVDAYDMLALERHVSARLLTGNHMRAVVCAVAQVVVPVCVALALVYLIVLPESADPGGEVQWRNLCRVDCGWDRWFLKVVNKFVGVVLVLYMYNFMESQHYLWGSSPVYRLYSEGCALRAMERPVYCGAGLLINAVALSLCGLVSIIVVYYSETPLDIVLNSLALFFLVEIDNLLVDKYDYERNVVKLQRIVDDFEQSDADPADVPYPHFMYALVVVDKVLAFAKGAVLLSTFYIATCK